MKFVSRHSLHIFISECICVESLIVLNGIVVYHLIESQRECRHRGQFDEVNSPNNPASGNYHLKSLLCTNLKDFYLLCYRKYDAEKQD